MRRTHADLHSDPYPRWREENGSKAKEPPEWNGRLKPGGKAA
jgi:hypothetical protein